MFNYVSIIPKASVTKQNSKFSRGLYFITNLSYYISRKPFVRQTVLRKVAKFHMSFMYLHLHLTDKTNIQFVQRIFVRHATQHFIQTMQLVSVKKNENGETWLSHVTLFCALWANKV